MANLKLIKKLAYKRGCLLKDIAQFTNIPFMKIRGMIETGNGTIEDLEKIAGFLNVSPIIFFLSEKNLILNPDKVIGPTTLNQLKEVASRMLEIFKNYEEGVDFIKNNNITCDDEGSMN